jgi:hypothetical protein
MELASGAPDIMVPIANHDDNQHAANENLRVQNLWDGIDTMAALFAMQCPPNIPLSRSVQPPFV